MDDNLNDQNKKKKKIPKSQNFIEAMKDVGGSIKHQVKSLGSGMGKSAVDSIFGRSPYYPDSQMADKQGSYPKYPQPSKPFNFEEYLYNQEKKIRVQERTLAQRIRENEKILYHHKEEEAKKQILIVQEEIKKIVKETAGLATELIEAEKTVNTTVVAGGTYHLNFFERVKKLLQLARQRIAESKNWLELFNSRKKQKYLYWAQVKKSGTKFMLSQERYMATQAG